MDWVRLGLNAQDEWIEEKNGKRRIRTLEGVIVEDTPSFRFGRLTSPEDAVLLCRMMSYSHAFQSYGSLIKAFSVWTTSFQKPFVLKKVTDKAFVAFKKEVEKHLAERVFQAYVYNRWHPDLPDWSSSLLRHGHFDHPLAIDIGLFKKENPPCSSLDELTQWIKSQNIRVGLKNNTWEVCCGTKTYHLKTNKELLEFATAKPKMVSDDTWIDEYTPFSLPQKEKTITGFVPPLLYQALGTYMQDTKPLRIQQDVQKYFNDDLFSLLSADQVDAVWMALAKLQKGQAFLLADETGYGKGRVLAALSCIALQQNIRVLFVTEKKGLFSDFYRDCQNVFSSVPGFSLLQSNVKIFTPQGKTLTPPLIKKASCENWIWTTYSQFNNKNKEKVDSVLSWMSSPTWLILDEAQNAAGQSNTFEVIEKFSKKAKGVMFSSATFAKSEAQLAAYRKVGSYSNAQWKRLQAAFGESNTVRTALSIDWAKNGHFLRRQHPPQSLPDEKWMASSSSSFEQDIFSLWWQKMYLLACQWSKHEKKTPWNKIGGAMSRALREFSLLQKTPFLIEEIKRDIANNRKSVVVSDWTLSSHVARLIKSSPDDLQDDIQEKEVIVKNEVLLSKKPTWKKSWEDAIEEMFDVDGLEYAPVKARQKIEALKEEAIKELRKMPDWSVSPFDELMLCLKKENIKAGEISGRSWQLIAPNSKQGSWKIAPLKAKPRPEIIFDFNEGGLDVVLLTRAGNSGVSLHASQDFSDQRQRHLIEWDVAPDPSVRLQFWGRVRRRDQTSEPLRSTLLIDTPFERRNQSRNTQKQQKILSHTGEQTIPHAQKYADIVCEQWEIENPKPARIVDPSMQGNLSQVLLRSVILKSEDQASLMNAAQDGLALFNDIIKRDPVWNKPSRLARSLWFWGLSDQELVWQERLWPMKKTLNKEDVFHLLQNSDLLDWSEAFPSQTFPLVNKQTNNGWGLLKGQGVVVTDPQTGQRVRAVLLGYEKASSDSMITSCVHLLLSSHTKPIKTSLLALLSNGVLNAHLLNKPPQPSWFDGLLHPVRCMVLTGPAWSVSAWGERNAPQGELCHLINENGSHLWGWRMPQQYTFEDIKNLPKELASIRHAQAFMTFHPSSSQTWVFSPSDKICVTPQADGVLLKGSIESINEHIPFPSLRQMRPMRSPNDKERVLLCSYQSVPRVFASWFGQGGSPNIPASFALWHKNTWAQYAPK